jgi:hypothetical protein
VKNDFFLGFIAVFWPMCWAIWNYLQDRKVKLSVLNYGCQSLKDENDKIIESIKFDMSLFNYGDRPVGILEIWHESDFDSIPLFFSVESPMLLLPNTSLSIFQNFHNKDEKVKTIKVYLADERTFVIKGRILKFLNERLSLIGEEEVIKIKVTKK